MRRRFALPDESGVSPQRATVDARAFLPASGIPLLYFAFAHLCLALACVVLSSCQICREPPSSIRAWPPSCTSSRSAGLGWNPRAFYIVGPLALRLPLRPGWLDRIAWASFVAGTIGMVSSFWAGEYSDVSRSAALVADGRRVRRSAGVARPLARQRTLASKASRGSSLRQHAADERTRRGDCDEPAERLVALGAAVGCLRARAPCRRGLGGHDGGGIVVRLIPMILPAAMPVGSSMAASAILLETGVAVLAVALLTGSKWTTAGALLVVAGLSSFVARVRTIVKAEDATPGGAGSSGLGHMADARRLHLALRCGASRRVARDTSPDAMDHRARMADGTLGLVGFLAQIVVGIQGRLLPMHGWYRAFEARGMQPPPQSVHTLADPLVTR